MPAKGDTFDATPNEIEAKMETGIEKHDGKPLARGTLQLNLAAMERGLAVQEGELKFLATRRL